MIMTVNGFLSFFFCMIEVVFIRPANPKEAPNTYVLRNGVANISFEIDKRAVDGYYVDVFNPRKKKIFQCLGTNPENVSLEFKGKVQLSGDYKIGTISFSVLNATEEDAGMYTSVIEMRGEQIGSQLLVVFAQLQTPKIYTTKTANNREESGQTLTCQVETNGTPPGYPIPISYKWKRNGLPVEHNDKYGIQNSALIIKYLQSSDLTDSFTCLAQNDYGAQSPESTPLTIAPYSIPIDACSTNQCLNGRCEVKMNSSNDYDCVCKESWSGTNCNIDASSKLNTSIPGVVGAGCGIIAIILLTFGILYRRHKARVYMDAKINSEEVYHDVKRVQSGDYWTIEDEQIYDIRRRIKSEVLMEASNTNPSDDYPYLQSEGCMVTVKDGIKTAADGYLNPAFSMPLSAELKSMNAPRNSQNFCKPQNAKQDDHLKYDEDMCTVKESLLNY